uniref:LOW QUALITY PROTEIN: PC-esterase domain-containing protein 1A-like n=1 Tax=Styela clava TaxID=7725 RepID=UPI00193AD8AC|nr:LOW QUALITY PROTEIN: PC-esterase domain-containing protein 1A-like [Styela clava]
MGGIYLKENLEDLLSGKYVLLLGDSVQRSVYKDLVVLCHGNRFMAQSELRQKGEDSFLGDELIHRSELTNGVHYREEREYKNRKFHFKFHFLTRVYNKYVESILKDIEKGRTVCPDVLVLNSCLWDISRYGDNSMNEYRENIEKLCKRLKEMLPHDTLVIWRTALPVSENMKGGLTPDAEKFRDLLRLDILRGNYFAYNIVSRYSFDVLDMHFHFRHQLHRRANDGVHWNMYAHRRMTNLLLSHISRAWDKELPLLPWADNSRIEFEFDDIEMNTTKVLKQAYEPISGWRRSLPPLMEIPPKMRNRNSGMTNALSNVPIYSQKDYSNMYSTPAEEDYDASDGGMYQLLTQDPIFDRSHRLPTSPYPAHHPFHTVSRPHGHLSEHNPNLEVGPMRHVKKWSSRNANAIRQQGNATDRIKMRIQKDRMQARRLPPSRNISEKYYESPRASRHIRRSRPEPLPRQYRGSYENHWSQFSRHHPQYTSYDDRFQQDTLF